MCLSTSYQSKYTGISIVNDELGNRLINDCGTKLTDYQQTINCYRSTRHDNNLKKMREGYRNSDRPLPS